MYIELRPKAVLKGNLSLIGKVGDILTVQIDQISTNSYFATSTSNFSDFVGKHSVQIL